VTFIGDGGTSEGAFYEAINLAGARALPPCSSSSNNGWAISGTYRTTDGHENSRAEGDRGRHPP